MSEVTGQVDTEGLEITPFGVVNKVLLRNGYPIIPPRGGALREQHPLLASTRSRNRMFRQAMYERSVAVRALFAQSTRGSAEDGIATRERLIFECLNVEALQPHPHPLFLQNGVRVSLRFDELRRPTHIYATMTVTQAILRVNNPELAARYLQRMVANKKGAGEPGWTPVGDEHQWLGQISAQLPENHPVNEQIDRLIIQPQVYDYPSDQIGYEQTA